jgi:hypothetical protein
MIHTQEPAASPMEATFAPFHCYAEACVAAQEGMMSFARASSNLMQAYSTLAFQQVQLASGMSQVMAAAMQGLGERRAANDPLGASLGNAATHAWGVFRSFDADPRWTTPPPRPDLHA